MRTYNFIITLKKNVYKFIILIFLITCTCCTSSYGQEINKSETYTINEKVVSKKNFEKFETALKEIKSTWYCKENAMQAIRWKRKSTPEHIRRIMDKFNIPNQITVNRVTLFEVKEEDMEQLREVEKRGFIQIINYEND